MGYPRRGRAHVFTLGLRDRATGQLKANPTLAEGDFKVSLDGGSLTNLDTTPSVEPASGPLVKVTLSATEMDAERIDVVAQDAAGDEWDDVLVTIQTDPAQDAIYVGSVTDSGATETEFADTDTPFTVNDQPKGRVVIFAGDTTAALKGQATTITAFNATTKAFTVGALTTAPDIGDTYVVL